MGSSVSALKKKETLPFPKHGVKLSALHEFVELNGGRTNFENLTTTEVNIQFQMKNTEESKSSYCEWLLSKNNPNVGIATVFISHAWKYKFLDVVDALQNHFSEESETIIWFDLFSNNQHKAVDLDFEWWSSTFKSAIQQFGRTVMVLSPWDNPIPLKRAWCLFEVYCTAVTQSNFEVAMSMNEKANFLIAIKQKSSLVYNNMLANIDLNQSEAWNPKDKQRIFEVVKATKDGFSGLNGMVLSVMREWVIKMLDSRINNPASTLEELLVYNAAKAEILVMQGNYKDALDLYVDNLQGLKEFYGDIHLNVGVGYTNVGNVLNHQGKFHESVGYFQLSKNIFEKDPEKWGSYLSDCYVGIGISFVHLNKNLEAIENYEKALTLKIATDGNAALDVASIYANLATVYQNIGNYDLAFKKLERALEAKVKLLGKKHPDVASVYNNMGVNYFKQKDYTNALIYYQKALKIREEKLGSNHIDLARSYLNIAVFYEEGEIKDYAQALIYYQKCLEIKLKICHPNHEEIANAYNNLAKIHFLLKDIDKALEYMEKIRTISINNFGNDHDQTKDIDNRIQVLKGLRGKAHFMT